MNIDEMQAGPEMDRLIAEQVMGWTKVPYVGSAPHFGAIGHHPFFYWCSPSTHEGHREWKGSRWKKHHNNYYSPSINIAHAWEVVELLGLTIEPGWHVVRVIGGSNPYRAKGETAPLAICRCALKVVTA